MNTTLNAVYLDTGLNRPERKAQTSFEKDVAQFLNIEQPPGTRSNGLYYFHHLITNYGVSERYCTKRITSNITP